MRAILALTALVFLSAQAQAAVEPTTTVLAPPSSTGCPCCAHAHTHTPDHRLPWQRRGRT